MVNDALGKAQDLADLAREKQGGSVKDGTDGGNPIRPGKPLDQGYGADPCSPDSSADMDMDDAKKGGGYGG